MRRPRLHRVLGIMLLGLGAHSARLAAQERGAVALVPLVEGLGVSARVLMIGAHPDDEDTQLIAWLARGRQVETAYLSLTRGDGGQNIIGDELGEPLGAIRTEELLAARRLDGGRQYFTRAFDFGFSKSAQETLTQWSRDSILRDVVTVIRAFRPHVIVSVFSGTPADGHGHHQVAGMLAREGWDVSADTVRFPRSVTAGRGAWTVSKFYRLSNFRNQERTTLRINVGEYDAIRGRSLAEIAAESRAQHRSQAMGSLQPRGVIWDQLSREASRTGPSNARTETSLFDGIDTTWTRFRGAMRTKAQRTALDSIPAAFAGARSALDPRDPGSVIPALVRLQRLLDRVCGEASETNPCATLAVDGSLVVRDAELHAAMEHASARLERALALASGVSIEAVASREVYAVGETARVAHTVYNRGRRPVRHLRTVAWTGSRPVAPTLPPRTLLPDSSHADSLSLPMTRIGSPWWLDRPRRGPMFSVPGNAADEASLRVTPVLVTFLEVEGASFGVFTAVTRRVADAVRGELNLPVVAAPAITVTLEREVEFARASSPISRTVTVALRSHAAEAREVDVRLQLPAGLTADSTVRRVTLPGSADANVVHTVTFAVRGMLPPGRHEIRAVASSRGETFASGYAGVEYEHIATQRLYRPATLGIEAVDVTLPRDARIAYVNGVGDNIAPILQQLGLEVTVLDPAEIPRTDLSRFTSVVVGTRAYDASPTLVANNPKLLEYARNGGTLVVQYGQYEMLAPGMMPFPITLGRPADRVTVEDAEVRVLPGAPPVLTSPNVVTARDFQGWVQDRSLYMPRTFDAAYQPVIEMNDPGETANRGGLLVAPYGKGVYVYTTLAFFRQLPNGVPGAARLFVNLLAARPGGVTQ